MKLKFSFCDITCLFCDEDSFYAGFESSEGFSAKVRYLTAFDRISGRLLYRFELGYTTCHHLVSDGARLFVATDSELFVLEKKTGKKAGSIFKSGISDLLIDGTWLMAYAKDGIWIWDKDTLKSMAHYALPGPGTFAVDGDSIYCGHEKVISILEKSTGNCVKTIEKSHEFSLFLNGRGIVVDDNYIYSAKVTRIHVLDKHTGEKISEDMGFSAWGGTGIQQFHSLAVDDTYIYGACSQGVLAWNKHTKEMTNLMAPTTMTVPMIGRTEFNNFGGLNVDEKGVIFMLTADTNIFSILKCPKLSVNELAHTKDVKLLAIDARYVYSVSDEKVIKVWDKSTHAVKHELTGHSKGIKSISTDNDRLYSVSDDKTIKIWNPETGALERTLQGHTKDIKALILDKDLLISSSDDKTVKIWEKSTGALKHDLIGHSKSVKFLAVDDEQVYSASDDKTIKIWNKQTGSLKHTIQAHQKDIKAISIDEPYIYSGSDDKTVKIWDKATGNCIKTIPLGSNVLSIQARSKSVYIYTGDGKICVWSIDAQSTDPGTPIEIPSQMQVEYNNKGEVTSTNRIIFDVNRFDDGFLYLISGKILQVWNTQTNELVKKMYVTGTNERNAIEEIEIDKDNLYLRQKNCILIVKKLDILR